MLFSGLCSSGDRIRTYDLWVMSPTSYLCSTPQYIFRTLFSEMVCKDNVSVGLIQEYNKKGEISFQENFNALAVNMLRIFLLVSGFLFTFLAFLGALLPVLPTTPFLLLAAASFYRSSPRFYHWIMYNPFFGHYLRDYQSGQGIPLRIKIMSLSFLWLSTSLSILFFIPWLWLKLLVGAITLAITVHIAIMRTKR